MAGREQYRIDVTANTSQIVSQIRDVNTLVDQLSRNFDNALSKANTSGLNNNFTITQKQMDGVYRSMQSAVTEATNLKRALRDASEEFGSRGNIMGASMATAQLKNVEEQINKIKSAFNDLTNMRQTQSSAFKVNIDDTDLKEYYNRLDQVQRKSIQVTDILHRQRNALNQATRYASQLDQTHHLTYSQARTLNSTLSNSSRSQAEDSQLIQHMLEQEHSRYANIQTQISSALKSGNMDATEITRMKQQASASEDIIKNLHRASVQMEDITARFGQVQETVSRNGGIRGVTPDKDSWRGMLASRAPAIGLNAMLAAGAVVGGLYARGSSTMGQMRPDIEYMNNQTGGFGGIADTEFTSRAMNQGKAFGFNPTDSMSMYTTMLANAGYTGMGNLSAGANQMMAFARATGLNANDTNGFFGAIGAQGGVNSAAQIKYIQQGIIGAVKQSGMEGRQKEQIQALQNIVQNGSTSRNMSSADIRNYMATQQALAMTGSRALQGASGARAINTMDQGIQNGYQNPLMAIAMGMGTKYTGISGYWQLQEQMQKGATPDNISTVFNNMSHVSGGITDLTKTNIHTIFPSLTTDDINGLYQAVQSGNLTPSGVNKILKQNQKTGADLSNSNLNTYNNSKSSGQDKSAAATDIQSVEMYNSALGEGFRNLNTALSGAPVGIYAFMAALAAVTVQLVGTSLALGGSRGLKRMTTGTFEGEFGSAGTGGGRSPRGGGTGGGSGPTIVGADGRPISSEQTTTGRRSILSRVRDRFSSSHRGGSGGGGPISSIIAGGESLGAKGIGSVSSGLVRGLGMLGDFEAAKSGANLGDMFGDWIFGHKKGQQVAPSVLGNPFAGKQTYSDSREGLLGRAWHGITGMFSGGNQQGYQAMRDDYNKRRENERQRDKNNRDEKGEHSVYYGILKYADRLLAQARQQGGIFGIGGGNSSGGSSSSSSNNLSKSVKSSISTAMKSAGVSGSDWSSGLSYIIQHESGGNAKAVGAKTSSGTAKGLMQLKDFNSSGNPFDPVNNVEDGIAYIQKRYGTIQKAVDHWKKYKWYASGTSSSAGSNVVVGDGGESELVQTPFGQIGLTPNTPTAYSNFPQGSQITPLSKIPVIGGSGGGGAAGGSFHVSVDVAVDGNGNAQIKDPRQLKSIGNQIGAAINPMNFFSKNMQRT